MTYPRQTSLPMGIVVIVCIRPSVQLFVSFDFGIAENHLEDKSTFCHAEVSRWLTLTLLLLMSIIVTNHSNGMA